VVLDILSVSDAPVIVAPDGTIPLRSNFSNARRHLRRRRYTRPPPNANGRSSTVTNAQQNRNNQVPLICPNFGVFNTPPGALSAEWRGRSSPTKTPINDTGQVPVIQMDWPADRRFLGNRSLDFGLPLCSPRVVPYIFHSRVNFVYRHATTANGWAGPGLLKHWVADEIGI